MPQAEAPPELFVVFGPSKSGTTWVQKMLDAHPEVSCEFQPPLLSRTQTTKADSLGVTLADGTPFAGVFADSDDEQRYRSRLEFLRKLDFLRRDFVAEAASKDVGDEILLMHRNIVRTTVSAYLDSRTDKPIKGYKSHADLDYVMEVFPGARFVLVVRDGRDVCVSMRHHRLRQGLYYVGDERWSALSWLNRSGVCRRATKRIVRRFPRLKSTLFRDLATGPLFSEASLGKAAHDWRVIADLSQAAAEKYPSSTITVRYEDLLNDPVRSLRSIFEFLGAGTSGSVVDSIVEAHTMARLKKSDDKSFFRKGVAGDWTNVFTDGDVQLFKQVAGESLIQLGYEPDNEWGLN